MKLDVTMLRYLTSQDFRVLTAVEMGMKNHEYVPVILIERIGGLKRGGAYKSLMTLLKHKLVHRESQSYEGYKLTYLGYDFLALRAISKRESIVSVGRQIGVGKESDIFVCAVPESLLQADASVAIDDKDVDETADYINKEAIDDDIVDDNDGENASSKDIEEEAMENSEDEQSSNMSDFDQMVDEVPVVEACLKLHRLGRVSFRTVKNNRDYMKRRTHASWIYLSRLAAIKEFAYMKVLYDAGFSVPKPLDSSRHCLLMELLPAVPLNQVKEAGHPDRLLTESMDTIVKLARHGLVHCDFNEFNIMVTEDEKICFIDFPQMISIDHANAKSYFDRDVECIRQFFLRRFDYEVDGVPCFDEDVIKAGRLGTLDGVAEASGFSKTMQKAFEQGLKEGVIEEDPIEGSSEGPTGKEESEPTLSKGKSKEKKSVDVRATVRSKLHRQQRHTKGGNVGKMKRRAGRRDGATKADIDWITMLHSLFLIDSKGEVIVEKHWKGTASRAVCDYFWDEVHKASSPKEVLPIITTPKHYLFHVQRNGIFFLGVAQEETAPLMIIEFLHRVADMFREYFDGELSVDSIKSNTATVLQILDEMMDNGYPFTTEPNILKEMVLPPTMLNKAVHLVTGEGSIGQTLPDGSLSNVPWRRSGVKYASNEFYMDIVEEIDAVVDSNGLCVSSEIAGSMNANCRLSGMPDCLINLSNARSMDDCSFHPCVRYFRWETERVVSFVPPDGRFKLLSYRVRNMQGQMQLPVAINASIRYEERSAKVEVTLKPKDLNGKTMENVKVIIPFPKCVGSAMLSGTSGSVSFDQSTKVCTWDLGKVKEHNPQKSRTKGPFVASLTGTATYIPGADSVPETNPDLSLEFVIPLLSTSGIKVNSFVITGEKYKPYKGVRTITKAGRFHVRC